MTNRERTDLKILGTLFTIILIGVMAFILTSCNPNVNENSPEQSSHVLDSNSRYYPRHYEIYTLDGCEYIKVGIGNNCWGSHKGNCKNPIHQHSVIDTTEKHFDCTVESIETGDSENKYMYTTECGIAFYSNQKYQVGETLKNFKSPKHK